MSSQSSQGWIEKRNFARVEANFKVRYRPVEAQQVEDLKQAAAYQTAPEKWGGQVSHPGVQALTNDISAGGVSLVSKQALAMGSYALLDIEMSQVAEPLRALAKVVRVQEAGEEGVKMGLQLVAVNRDAVRRIEDLVAARQKKLAAV